MIKKELVSVIVPVYKVEPYIHRCIESIVNQTYKNIEIILVDDGSPDNCGEICDEYARKDSRIKVIHKQNQGLGMARNTGLDNMSGSYFAFVDSDDYISENHIESMMESLKKYNADACITGYKKVYADRIEEHENEIEETIYSGEDVKQVVIKMSGKLPNGSDFIEPSVCKCLFSSDVLKSNSIRFVSERNLISEDLIFDLEYYLNCKRIVRLPQCTYHYCDNMGSLTTRYNPERFEKHKILYEYLIEFMEKNSLLEETKVRIQTNFLNNIRHCIRLENTYKKENGSSISKNKIKKICKDNLVQKILSDYPNNQVKLSSRIFNLCIKHNVYFLLNNLKRK